MSQGVRGTGDKHHKSPFSHGFSTRLYWQQPAVLGSVRPWWEASMTLLFPGQTLVPGKTTFQWSPGTDLTAWQASCLHCSRPMETAREREVVVSPRPDPKKDLCVLALTPTAPWEGHHGQTVPTAGLHSQNSCSYRVSMG